MKPSLAKVQQLKRQRKEKFDKAQTMRAENQDARSINTVLDEVERLTGEIDLEENLLAAEESMQLFDGDDPAGRRRKYTGNHSGFVDASNGQELRSFRAGDQVPESEVSLGRMLQAARTGNWRNASAEERELRAAGTTPGSAGGFAIPEDVSDRIWTQIANKSTVLKSGATIVKMPHGTMRVARVDSVSALGWFAENELIDEASITFGAVTLTARKAAAIVKVGNELLQDAANIDRELERAVVDALSQAVDFGGLAGDGVDNSPLGLLEWVDGASNPLPTTAIDSELTWADMIAAYYRLQARNAPESIAAIMHPLVLAGLDNEREATGGIGFLLGTPKAITNTRISNSAQVPIVGDTTSQVLLGDFSNLLIGAAGGGLHVEWFGQPGADYDQSWLRVKWRIDFAPIRTSQFEILSGVTLPA